RRARSSAGGVHPGARGGATRSAVSAAGRLGQARARPTARVGTQHTAKSEPSAPRAAIGKNTAENMQSGAVFGFAGLVDGLVRRFAAELGGGIGVIANGRPAGLGGPHLENSA